MNKNRKMVIVLLFAFVVCFSLSGCTLQDRIEEYSSDKEQCYLNTENVTRFSYKGNDYTILADTVSNGGLGEWIGYIRQLAAIDEKGKILLQENVEMATFHSLADLAEKAPEAAYIIPFLNVYAAPNADAYLIVDINGGYHKAVISENVKDNDMVFDFKKTEKSINGSFEVNPENATQLLCGGTIYQVTSDMVSDDELGSYIDILAESVTFDTETKIPLSKEDLSKIDWYGENAGQGRENWFYTDIYEIFAKKDDPTRPYQYSMIQNQIMTMIRQEDIRDDNGEFLKFGTHIFRHCYGKKLTEMHVDDWMIAKLLGHTSIYSVHHYRKIGNKLMADETRAAREKMDMILLDIIEGWDDYEI